MGESAVVGQAVRDRESPGDAEQDHEREAQDERRRPCGLHADQALAAVLLYRLASFWLVALAGWLVLLWLQHRNRARRDSGTARNRAIAHATGPGTGQRRGR
jgi:hypothetical protein